MSTADATSGPPPVDPLEAGEAGGKVIRGGGLRAAGHVAGVLIGLLSAPLVVRHLGPEDFGRYLTVTSIIFIVTGLTEGGLNNVAIRAYAIGSPERRVLLVRDLAGLRVVLSLIGGVLALLFGVVAGYDGVLIGGLAIGSIGYVLAALQGAYAVPLQAGLRLGSVAGIDLVRSVATTALLLALVAASASLTPFFAVVAVVHGLALAMTLRLVRGTGRLRPRADLPAWKELAQETVVYAAATALGAVYFQVALVAMSVLSSTLETGYYAIAFRIVDLANGIPWIFAASVLPVLAHAAEHDRVRLRYVAGRVFEGALLAGGLFSLAIVVGAEFGIDVIAGREGAPAVEVLRVLGIGISATFLVACLGFVLLSLRRYRDLMWANGLALLLALALSAVLIPSAGAVGGAWTTAALEVTLAVTYAAILGRREPDLRVPLSALPRVALAYGLGLAAGLPLLAVHPVPATVAALTVYLGVLMALKAVPPELLDAIRSRLRR